jgi:hypothetical protein
MLYVSTSPRHFYFNVRDYFQKPQDIFQSKFVIQLLTHYFKWTKGSRYKNGMPFGAIAMAATAVSH